MIFVSIALLVVAAVALGVGIASSSVPPLVVSILATLAAAGTLWASFIHYRQEAANRGASVTGLGGNTARQPGYPEVYAPGTAVPTAPAQATVVAPTPAAFAPPADWDLLPDQDAADLVEAHNLDELHELRRYEVEHSQRSEVLAAIDERITNLVALRRRVQEGSPAQSTS